MLIRLVSEGKNFLVTLDYLKNMGNKEKNAFGATNQTGLNMAKYVLQILCQTNNPCTF